MKTKLPKQICLVQTKEGIFIYPNKRLAKKNLIRKGVTFYRLHSFSKQKRIKNTRKIVLAYLLVMIFLYFLGTLL